MSNFVKTYVDEMVDEIKGSGEQCMVLWDNNKYSKSAMIFVPGVDKNGDKYIEVISVDESENVVTSFLKANAIDSLMGYFKVNDF